MQHTDQKDGSLHDEMCANTDSPRTANNTSPPEEIISATAVPLYLVPRAVADVIRQHKRSVREIHIRRTRNHFYAIDLKRGRA